MAVPKQKNLAQAAEENVFKATDMVKTRSAAPQRTYEVREDASTGFLPEMAVLKQKNPTQAAEGNVFKATDMVKTRSTDPQRTYEVREDASTGFLPEMATPKQKNLVQAAWKTGINGIDADDNTEHRSGAYIEVREHSSTGLSPQIPAKHSFPFGVYIHWPYCLSKCPYCDFFSRVQKNVEQEKIIEDYLKELDFYYELCPDETVSSIFFGGGTPSLLKPELIEKIINHICKRWSTQKNIEISLEANPNTDNGQLFRNLKEAGINRLSLGVQALNDNDLKFLGRTHNLQQAIKSIDSVLKTFDNHSMDLIYARPQQKRSTWIKELNLAVSFGFKHLSLYQLTIEEGTFFAQKGIKPLEDETAAILYQDTGNILSSHAYERYEISNYAQTGFASRHNLLYWQGDNYLGIGPAAHGRIKSGNNIYATTHCCCLEQLTPEERAEELLITGLRLKQGIDKKHFKEQCGIDIKQIINPLKLREIISLRMAEETENNLRLTAAGFLLTNKIIEELFG